MSTFTLILLIAAFAAFGVTLYARWRMLHDDPTPGYLIPPGEPGSWYEYTDETKEYVRPKESTRTMWSDQQKEIEYQEQLNHEQRDREVRPPYVARSEEPFHEWEGDA